MKWICLIVGGALGTISRYLLDGAVHKAMGQGFPYGTLVINLSGCFLLGFFVSAFNVRFAADHNLQFFLIVGLCGAFTTFSTFILQTAELVDENMLMMAALNVAISIAAGFIFFILGSRVGKIL